MRLIDADALKKAILDYLEDDNGNLPTFNEITSNDTLIDILRVVYAMPTVDAIPVEWIEEWGSQNGMSESMSLSVMIEDWRKENETE